MKTKLELEQEIRKLEESLEAYTNCPGNWETCHAEVVIGRMIKRLRDQLDDSKT